ncbi:AAA family ATPase [Ruegeria hyattellae]|uniref:AAA family ATPase n=1 Tax=Ruegeria hyattellae TaxID=3233337 RepID=UPI00355B4792
MQRVMIVGQPGSGKSTLALHLGRATGLPVYHMDHLHWLPSWQPRPRAEKIAMAHQIEARPCWVFEGGLSATYDNRLARADTVIWLDLPVALRLWRVTRRMIRNRGQNRPDMAEGCIEGWHSETPEFYRFIWRTRRSSRARLLQVFDQTRPDQHRFRLRNSAQVRDYLRFLEGKR